MNSRSLPDLIDIGIQYLRGFCHFILNFSSYRKVCFPLRIWPNVYVNHKHNISLGKAVSFPFGAYISPLDLVVGDNTWLGVRSFICGKVIIGSNVMIGPNVCIPGANHVHLDISVPMRLQGLAIQGTVIQDDVWIGANVTILDGVTIGEGSIVAAGAVVVSSCPPFSILGGVPAQILKSRIPSL